MKRTVVPISSRTGSYSASLAESPLPQLGLVLLAAWWLLERGYSAGAALSLALLALAGVLVVGAAVRSAGLLTKALLVGLAAHAGGELVEQGTQ